MPLLGSVGGVLWSSRAKAGLVNANRKSRALLSSTASAKGRRGRESIHHGAVGESHYGFRFVATQWLPSEGMRLCEGPGVSLKSLQAVWPDKKDAEAATP